MGSFVKFYTDMTGNECITFMIDTGADSSIFKREKISEDQIFYPGNSAEIRGVTDGILKTLGTTTTTLFNDELQITHDFHIVSNNFPIPCDAILGLNFIQKFKCVLDYEKSVLILNLKNTLFEIPIYDSIEYNTLVIPPRCQIVKKVNLENITVDSVVNATEIANGVHIARTIISPKDTRILVINTTNDTIVVNNPKITTQPLSHFHIQKITTQNNDTRLGKILQKIKKEMPNYVQDQLIALCKEFSDIFALEEDKLSHNNFYEQELILKDHTPVYVKPYRLPYSQREEVKKQVELLQKKDLIEASRSPYNSPLLLVPKKSDNPEEKKFRLVVDFRQVNKKLAQDKFQLPRIDSILDELGRAKWFSVIDLMSGFHQIPLKEESRDITSFSIEGGSFRFKRLPFGLNVSCNSFQRMMTMAFSGLPANVCFLYVDDVIVTGCSEQHHLRNLRKVFEVCRNCNLKLNPAKCQFFKTEVTYLGHKISEKGVLPDDSKFDAIKNYPIPKNADEVRRFTAFCNYYRRFAAHFAEITYPLNQLTKKGVKFEWTPECNKAFVTLKNALMNPPILQYPNFSKVFTLSTDASNIACGAVLSQETDGIDLPIAFASKKFTKGEANKSTIEKELTAIHWSINYFKPFLYGRKFIVKSDHRPLVYLFSMKNPSSKLTRMRLDLEEYDFEIKYVKGSENTGPDALSRININELQQLQVNVAKIVTRAQAKEGKIQKETNSTTERNEREKKISVFEVLNNNETYEFPQISFKISPDQMSFVIREYNLQFVINKRVKTVTRDNKPESLRSTIHSGDNVKRHSLENSATINVENVKECTSDRSTLRGLLSELNKIAGEKGIKFLKIRNNDELFTVISKEALKEMANNQLTNVRIAICNPIKTISEKKEKAEILKIFHNDPLLGGHAGTKRMLSKLKTYFTWKGIKKDVITYIKTCNTCKLNKPIKSGLENLTITPTPQKAFDSLIIDTIGPLPESINRNKYALTVICDLSKFLITIPIPDKEAKTLARALFQDVFLIFGIPKTIRSDLGTEYKNSLFTELATLLKYDHNMSTPYRHETLGTIERSHRTLNEYLRAYIDSSRTDWDVWIKYFTYCYNTTPNTSHNYTPFELVFGKTPNLPLQIFNRGIEPVYNIENFAKEFKYRLQLAQERAQKLLIKEKENRKSSFDKKANPIHLDIGEFVFVKKDARHKLESVHKGPFEVISFSGPNCTLKDGNKNFTVHKNKIRK